MSKSQYIKIIKEDKEWLLQNTKRSLEQDHIIEVLDNSIETLYKDKNTITCPQKLLLLFVILFGVFGCSDRKPVVHILGEDNTIHEYDQDFADKELKTIPIITVKF
jgi:hypothetical protein